jgi:ABC-type hemin transport system ATPase subunit
MTARATLAGQRWQRTAGGGWRALAMARKSAYVYSLNRNKRSLVLDPPAAAEPRTAHGRNQG